MKLYHLPREAVLGYSATIYPEYRKRIKDGYQPPPPCGDAIVIVPVVDSRPARSPTAIP